MALVNSPAVIYSYDAAGQMLSDGTRTFSWAAAGYLASATSPQGTASYSYNGFGQRVKKVIGTGVLASARHYLYAEDGVSLLGEYFQADAGAQVGTLNEVVYLEGIPVLVLAGGQTYFTQSDHLNTPRTIKNAAGAVVWRWESDAFGIGAPNQNPGGVMQFEFNARLPGQQFDAETGLYYNNARYYDQVTGRYISSDPIGLAGGINTYGYVGGEPLSNIDPFGLFRSSDWLRTMVPGQVAWDNALTSVESKNYVSAAVGAAAMLGEQLISVISLGGYSGVSLVARNCPVKIVSWAEAGATPNFAPGRWVPLGSGTKFDFWRTGLPGPKGEVIGQFPYLKLEASQVPFSNKIAGEISANSLEWPRGANAFRGLFGQRRLK